MAGLYTAMRRRSFIAAVTATVGTLAGCTGSGDSGGGGYGAGGGSTEGSDSPDSGGGTGFEDHPAVRGLDAQPTLGEPSGTAIIAFEDPSCTICKRFEENTFPEIRSELVEPGDATFTYRVYPIVYEWGKPAVQALEATYAADEAAFWGLKDFYYANQGRFGGGLSAENDDPLTGAKQYLSNETELDAEAIVQAAETKEYDDAVQADLAAGEDAGASSTPTFYLFRDGEFQTTVSGAQSYDVFAAALTG